jgi:fused signal recognition particle receptor
MFDSLRKKLREGVTRLSGKAGEPFEKPPKPKGIVKKPGAARPAKPRKPERERPRKVSEPAAERRVVERPGPEETAAAKPEEGRLARLRGIRERVSARELTERDVDDFFGEGETELLQSDVAIEVLDSLRDKLKEKLVRSRVRRGRASDTVEEAFRESLLEIVNLGRIDLEWMIKKSRKEGRPLLMVFLGFNGSGKTTSIAKLASYLKGRGFRPVLAAGDTFRAASIEQLEFHGERLGIRVIKHSYGSDSAAVIFDAVRYAVKNGLDAVLADTAGRAHTDRNLMDELRKVVRVNRPGLKVLVVDSLTGNDAVEQARQFHEAIGVDCVVMTKTDVNPRGGSILSVAHTIGKPILFLGTGQDYSSVEMFDPKKFVGQLLE